MNMDRMGKMRCLRLFILSTIGISSLSSPLYLFLLPCMPDSIRVCSRSCDSKKLYSRGHLQDPKAPIILISSGKDDVDIIHLKCFFGH